MTAGFLKRIYSGRRGFILLESGISLQGFRLTIVYFLTAAGRLKSSCRHSACIRTKKPRNVNEDLQDEFRREQIIEQILIVECSQRYNRHVKYTLERFKRPAAVKKIDYRLVPFRRTLDGGGV